MRKAVSFLLIVSFLFLISACGEKPTEEEKYFCVVDNNIKVLSLEGGDGLFVENGNFDEVKGVATIKVRNDSERMVEYSKISFRVNDIERAEFEIKALPSGETTTVMEITAKPFASTDKYELINNAESTFAAYCDPTMNTDKIKIETDGGKITVTNLTAEDISKVIIYYKYYVDGAYYGGIAFRGTFENVKAGKSVSRTSDRFAQNGKIVNTSVVIE